MKVKIQAKSINTLRKENPELFYDQDWYSKEKWATSKPKAETLYIEEVADSRGKTFGEQQKLLADGDTVPSVNQVIQWLIQHFRDTGECLLPDYYLRCSDLFSDGRRVDVGRFGAGGLCVSSLWDGRRVGCLGLAASKVTDTRTLENLPSLESLNFEIQTITINGRSYRLEMK